MSEEFRFTQIEGKLDLEQAGKHLVHLAQCIQRTHNNESAKDPKRAMQHMFDSRKQGIDVIMNLIQEYIDQMPQEESNTCDHFTKKKEV